MKSEQSERTVILSCPCMKELKEAKRLFEESGWNVQTPLDGEGPSEAVHAMVRCPLDAEEINLLQIIVDCGTVQTAMKMNRIHWTTRTTYYKLKSIAKKLSTESIVQSVARAVELGVVKIQIKENQ